MIVLSRHRAGAASGIDADVGGGGGLGSLLVHVDVGLVDDRRDERSIHLVSRNVDVGEVSAFGVEGGRHAHRLQLVRKRDPRLDPEARHEDFDGIRVAAAHQGVLPLLA